MTMTKQRATPRPHPADWHVTEHLTAHGRQITVGTELTVTGIRGRVQFMRHVTRDCGIEWVDVYAPTTAGWRSVRPSAIRVVHTRRKLNTAAMPVIG